MDKDTTKSTLSEWFSLLDTDAMLRDVVQLGLDKYTKKLDCIKFIRLLIFAQVKQIASLTDISAELNETEQLQRELGLSSISKSQLSRKLRGLDPAFLQSIFQRCVDQIVKAYGFKAATEKLGRINLVDSSTITMALSQYPWAQFRKSRAGVKLHLRLAFWDGLAYPDKAVMTPAKPADRSQMDNLVVNEPGALNLFDRGYTDYKKFDEYCSTGVRFITRLRENAGILEVYEERPVKAGSPVLRDAVVRLGSSFRSTTNPVRWIEILDDEGNRIIILTNDLSLDVQEVCDLYRKRWRIEIFFKWIKQHLQLKRLYGQSENAVYNQLWIALITYCQLVLLQRKVKHNRTLLDVYKCLRRHWEKALGEFLYYLNPPPSRQSKGRKSVDHGRMFAWTLQQYEDGDTEHLDGGEYGLMI